MRWASSAADLACFRKGAHVISQCQRGGEESDLRAGREEIAQQAAQLIAQHYGTAGVEMVINPWVLQVLSQSFIPTLDRE